LTFTISAYLDIAHMSGIGFLLGELDILQHDQRSFDVEYRPVIDARSDVVVGRDRSNVFSVH
jgi:hypothetical protein